MGVYISDVQMAGLFFPFVALIITFPILLWNYNRNGAISKWSMAVTYSLVFYLICAYFLIILPLPSRTAVSHLTTIKYNLHPFVFVLEFIKYNPLKITNVHTWIPALKNPTTIQPLFNIFLTIPFGVYLRIYFKRSLKQTILFSFLLSLFFELTQLSGLYGFYSRPYRLFDVDDLMLNTFGGWLGFTIGKMFSGLIPTDLQVKKTILMRRQKVTIVRHITAALLDLALVILVGIVILELQKPLNFSLGNYGSIVWSLGFLVVVLMPEIFFRETLGMRAVNVELVDSQGNRANKLQVVRRNIFGAGWFFLLTVLELSIDNGWVNGSIKNIIAVVMLILLLVVFLSFVIDAMLDLFRPEHDMLFEKLSGTRLKSSL